MSTAELKIWQSWNTQSGYGYWDTREEAELNSDEDYDPVLFVPAATPPADAQCAGDTDV